MMYVDFELMALEGIEEPYGVELDEADFVEDEEAENFPDDYWDEMGYNPYMGCYDFDC